MRQFYSLSALLVCATLTGCGVPSSIKSTATDPVENPAPQHVDIAEPVDDVWPWLDSANSRWFYFNSATRPFGMVNLSPDTEIDGAWGSGYRYNTHEIKGFNHVHAWQLSGLSVMPISRDGALADIENDYYSAFSHDDETVAAGYHSVHLQRYDIRAELTATTRVGFHRYTYSDAGPKQILLDLEGQFGPSALSKGEFVQISDTAFAGSIINAPTIRRPRPTPIYFYIELDQPVTQLSENNTAVLLGLADSTESVLMKVAISYVDIEGAKRNMQVELPGWDFSQTVAASRDTWNTWLSKIRVEGGSEQTRKRFYTDLFHALQGRRIVSDVDGRYADQTAVERRIKQLPLNPSNTPAFNHHNSDSFWGAQWTIQTLWPLVYPKVASDFSNSMLTMAQDGGYVPRGPSGGNYTYVMTGASSTPFIVSTYLKGIKDFDPNVAYSALKKNHLPGGMMSHAGYEHNSAVGGGLEYYISQGYVPYPLPTPSDAFHLDGAGQTLEYAYQDWTLAQLALELDLQEDATWLISRSKNYQNLYDTDTGFMRPKDVNGNWKTDFDPFEYRHGFVESNAAQMTWFVPHDVAGLADLMGGNDNAIERLNQAFVTASELGFTSGTAHAQETHEAYRRIPINYGNQPSIQTAFLFNQLGAPEKTQYWSREVVNQVYQKLSPEHGYNGDEDQGLMGSLAVLMKIGLFQVDGGASQTPIYQIGSPIFDRITIELDNKYYSGKTFTIETRNNSDENRYISAAWLNGEPLSRYFLTHQEITQGGVLTLEMAPTPAPK